MGLSVKRVLTICSNGSAPLNKIAAMSIYGKNLLLQNQESFEAESWYIASGTRLLSFPNDGRRFIFDLITARSILHPNTFVWGKCWKIIFSMDDKE